MCCVDFINVIVMAFIIVTIVIVVIIIIIATNIWVTVVDGWVIALGVIVRDARLIVEIAITIVGAHAANATEESAIEHSNYHSWSTLV